MEIVEQTVTGGYEDTTQRIRSLMESNQKIALENRRLQNEVRLLQQEIHDLMKALRANGIEL